MAKEIDLSKLLLPFKEEDVEWRIQSSGKKGNGQVWAMCLAYIQARAIMNRLDEVVGPENWMVNYRFASATEAGTPGVIASIAIKYGDQWIHKEDGAEQTDIESFKGGLSSALKRAGSAWGIGRYLYKLESAFATIVDAKTKEARYGKTKDGGDFHWVAPALPQWALPEGEKVDTTKPPIEGGGIHPENPPWDMGSTINDYRIPFGKFAKRALEEVDLDELKSYILYLERASKEKNKPIQGQVKDFIERACNYIGAIENTPLEPGSKG
jgi:hypothetical protein